MEDERTCSSRWPKFALFAFAGLSVVVGSALIGIGVYFYRNGEDIQTLFSTILKESLNEDFNILSFTFGSTLAIGISLIVTSVTLAIYGTYRMNRSCVAAYMTFTIFAFVVAAALGITVVGYEGKFLEDITIKSADPVKDKLQLEGFTRIIMIVTLILAAFQMFGVMFACCLLKAIEDINKL